MELLGACHKLPIVAIGSLSQAANSGYWQLPVVLVCYWQPPVKFVCYWQSPVKFVCYWQLLFVLCYWQCLVILYSQAANIPKMAAW